MAGLIIRRAGEDDHAALEELFRATPMGSNIRLGFERDPDYFAGARVQAEELAVWTAFEPEGRAVGLFSAGNRRVWLGGERPMRYLSDQRIHPDWQGSSLFVRGFKTLRREVFQAGEWAQTLVLEGNPRAMGLLTSGRGGLPEYRPAGRYATWLLPQQRIDAVPGIRVRRASSADLGAMQALLGSSLRKRCFAGLVNLADLGKPAWRDLAIEDFRIAERDGGICGVMGLWDQSGFQRLRIHGYSRGLAVARPFLNVIAGRFGVCLPKAGEMLPLRKACATACLNDDPQVLRALLAAALGEHDPRVLLFGCSVQDPLAAALHGLRARKEYGRHFLVGWEGSPPEWQEPFAFDVARI
jgi:hypothetical protein